MTGILVTLVFTLTFGYAVYGILAGQKRPPSPTGSNKVSIRITRIRRRE